MTDAQKDFIETVGKLAQADSHADRILPSVTIAQAILESGWGTSTLTKKGNALFGIKAGKDWQGKVYSCKTKECYDGVNLTPETAVFRAYDSLADSIADHGAFLCGLQRYTAVVGETDCRKACRALQAAGYATDPQYAGKLIGLIASYELTAYDKGAARTYLVQRGDTLTKISRLTGVDIDAIVSKNSSKYPTITRDYIQAGWELEIA